MKKTYKSRRDFMQKLGAASIISASGMLSFNSSAQTMSRTKLKIYNGRIITPYRVLNQGTIVVEGGKITAVSKANIEVPGAIEIDAKG